MAQAVASEMHAGFGALRTHMPMNLRRHDLGGKGCGPGVAEDIARICDVWRDCRGHYGAAGDFLFGAFGAADAMFAPVVTRLDTYGVALDEGANVVRVTVAATDGLATAVYTLAISRIPSAFGYDRFMDVSGLAYRRSMDIWADARTRWVSYDRSGEEAVLAFDASTGERAPGRDIAARAAGNKSPWALWSDGASLYVLDAWKSMVFQYSLDEGVADGFGAHVATVSLEGIGEDDARGLWSDGEHMWVANRDDAKVYAYELDGDRVSGEDFDTLAAAGNSMPVDLWSDGQVMWVLDKGWPQGLRL